MINQRTFAFALITGIDKFEMETLSQFLTVGIFFYRK